MIKTKHINDTTIHCQVPKIGFVKLSKFSPDFDHGIYRQRPWHIVTFGLNFATPEECLSFLESVASRWDDDEDDESAKSNSGVCHSEMTHSFLATEADLDSCPW